MLASIRQIKPSFNMIEKVEHKISPFHPENNGLSKMPSNGIKIMLDLREC
jgi:hypothetical protein